VSDTFNLQHRISKISISLNQLVLLVCFLVIAYFGYDTYTAYKTEQAEASLYIVNPKVNDIYFLDLRVLGNTSERKKKYQLAQVVSVTNDNVALVYGRYFYQWQYSVVNSIRYGELSNNNYFTLIPEYIPLKQIREMKNNDAIYLVKRPVQNKVYGNFVSP